jgi:hypothetical protein
MYAVSIASAWKLNLNETTQDPFHALAIETATLGILGLVG